MLVPHRRRVVIAAMAACALLSATAVSIEHATAGTAPTPTGSVELTWAPAYMAADTNSYSEADAVALAQKYDLVAGLPLSFSGYAATMRAANPNVVLLAYSNADFVATNATAGYDESMFAHDANGNRITSTAFGQYMMEPSSPEWQAEAARLCQARAVAAQLDGCLLDMLTMGIYSANYVSALPVVPGTTTAYTQPQWQAQMVSLATSIGATDPNQVLVGNAISNADRWNSVVSSEPITNALPAAQMEDYLRGSGDPVDDYPTAAEWLQNIGIVEQVQDSGRTILVSTKLWDGATPAQVAAWESYSMASFLMTADGQAYWAFTDSRTKAGATGSDLPYSMPKQIGAPTSDMTQVGEAYERSFAGGLAVVNPSTDTVTVSLGGPMTTLEGDQVTTLTLPPNSGDVLTGASVAPTPSVSPTASVTPTDSPSDSPTPTPTDTTPTVAPTSASPTPTSPPVSTTPTVTASSSPPAEPPPPTPTSAPPTVSPTTTPSSSNLPPTGSFTAPANNATVAHGRITIKGTASDDEAVKAVYVSIQNRTTGKYLTTKSTWSSTYQRLPATLAKKNAKATSWSIAAKIPAGKVTVTLIVQDSGGLLDPVPQPSRLLTLR